MSINITIQERGTPVDFTADAIQTALAGRSSARWIPKEDAQMAAVTIHKNGTYTAKKLGVNGIAEAEVDDKGGTAVTVTRRDLLGSFPTLAPAIMEGGAPFGFSANTLKVSAQGGGEALLVAADLKTGAKVITRPGKYKASSDGLYAWSSMRVDIDGGGSDFGEQVDHIAVTTLPTHTEYGDGAYINYEGIVVTAYNEQGMALGTIPFDELILPMNVAEYPGFAPTYTTQPIPESLVYSQLGIVFSFAAVGLYFRCQGNTDTREQVLSGSSTIYAVLRNFGSTNYDALIDASTSQYDRDVYENGSLKDRASAYSKSMDGLDFYYATEQVLINKVALPKLIGDVGSDRIAHDMIYFATGGNGGNVDVPVQWARPEDSKVLETSFMISVLNLFGGNGDD